MQENEIYAEPLDSTDCQEIPDLALPSAPAAAAEADDDYEDDKEVAADAITVFCTVVGVTLVMVGGWFTLTSITNAYISSGALDSYLMTPM